MVDLVALRALETVRRVGTVTAAAEELHLTPSAISHQIKRLERQLDTLLLERVGRLVVLTGDAGQLLDRVGPLLDQLDDAVAATSLGPSGAPRGVVRVAAFTTSITGALARSLATARREAPELETRITDREPIDALRDVATGAAELAVLHHWDLRPYPIPDHLTAIRLHRDVADVLVNSRDPLAGRRWVRPGELADRPWVSTGIGTLCHDWLTAMLSPIDRSPDIAHWSPDFAVHVELVRSGLASAVLPRLGRPRLPGGVRAIEVRGVAPVRHVELVLRTSQREHPTMRFLTERIAAAFAEC